MVPVLRQHGDDARVWTETRGSSVPRLGCRLGEHVLVGSIKGWVFAAILPLHELRDLSGQSLRQDPAAGLSPKRGAWSMGCASGALWAPPGRAGHLGVQGSLSQCCNWCPSARCPALLSPSEGFVVCLSVLVTGPSRQLEQSPVLGTLSARLALGLGLPWAPLGSSRPRCSGGA